MQVIALTLWRAGANLARRMLGGKYWRRVNQIWVILGAGFVVMFFSGGSRFALGLMLKPMTEEMGWTRSSLAVMGLITLDWRRPLAG